MSTKSKYLGGASTNQLAENAPVGQHFTHKLIGETAKDLAGEFWEQMATGAKVRRGKGTLATYNAANAFYRAWPDQLLFVDARWYEFIDCARGALVAVLGNPASLLSQAQKDEIAEALLLDGTVNPKKLTPEAEAAITARAKAPDMARLMPPAPDAKRSDQ